MDDRISAGLVVRDESRNLPALLSALRPHVDEIVVVDTGSVDDTVAVATRYADRVETYTRCNDAEGRIADFAMARNHCMSLCSHDWFLWLDGDDLLDPSALRDLVREAPRGEPLSVLAAYEYSYAPDGSVSCLLWRERLVWPRREFSWTGPVHETLGRRDGRAAGLRTEHLVVRHQRQALGKPADPGRNLRILEAHVARTGVADVRSMHYLGVELAAAGRHREAIPHLRRAAGLEEWDESRCQSLLALARSELAAGLALGPDGGLGEAVSRACAAASEAAQERSWPEPYYVMHRARLEEARRTGAARDWARAAHFARIGLALEAERAPGLLPTDPTEHRAVRSGLLEALGRLDAVNVSALMPPLGSAVRGPEEARERVVRDLRSCGLPEDARRLAEAVVLGIVEGARISYEPVRPPPPPAFPVLTLDQVGRPPA